ncbi:FCD domain-containing protein [Azospirillum thermophilum]|uniref:Pyruvate dehydrogenase complex repressor n=1 Tax=Azospirillum thermophilum TaxID=2202148 RepID=A0A2S2CMQ1_9PROT|nr:FCD domain-containing protein [Azospirillum thermophilum]AWK85736.1 GntR family transcriptional regulator [Azospirillum thermophilum]
MQGTIKPAKLADAIAEHLEKLILEGILRPGEKLLPERDLAVKLDVSRPSLRDALAKLEERGLLITGRNGTFIARFLSKISDPLATLLQDNPAATFDYLEFRHSIEAEAAALAARRATDLDRAAIRAIVERMRSAHSKDDSSEEAEADAELHLAVYEAAHNLVMLHIMRTLSELLRSDVFYNRADLYSRPGVRDLLLQQHLAIAEAVLSGDAGAARAAAGAHVQFTLRTLRDIRDSNARLEVSLRRIGRSDLIDSAG